MYYEPFNYRQEKPHRSGSENMFRIATYAQQIVNIEKQKALKSRPIFIKLLKEKKRGFMGPRLPLSHYQ